MKFIPGELSTAATMAALLLVGAAAVHAAPPNPLDGYISMHDTIMVAGANYGRCNAVGILAAKVCAERTLPAPLEPVLAACQTVGVDMIDDPEIGPCIEDTSCEALGTC